MMFKREEKSKDDFWKEYEESTGEKVLSRGLGRYISGWEEFDEKGWNNIWGLIIATSGGFRFHHFPQHSWLSLLSQMTTHNTPKEKTIFVQKEKIVSANIITETKWWKKIFSPMPPQLFLNYRDEAGKELCILLEVEYNSSDKQSGNFVEILGAGEPGSENGLP